MGTPLADLKRAAQADQHLVHVSRQPSTRIDPWRVQSYFAALTPVTSDTMPDDTGWGRGGQLARPSDADLLARPASVYTEWVSSRWFVALAVSSSLVSSCSSS